MNQKDKTGGPAFPNHTITRSDASGMTLRDYFAAKALAGITASVPQDREWYKTEARLSQKDVADIIAVEAYELADAMLRARKS